MRVVELTAYQIRIPLRKAIRHASHSRTETDNVVVRCVLDDGTEGFGEGVPRDYVTGETIDSSLALLRRSDLGPRLEPCRSFAEAAALAERLELAPVPGDERGCQGNAARCAVELALLDAYGHYFREPVSSTTQLLAPDLYEPRRWVQYSTGIASARGFRLRTLSLMMRLYRFRQVKLKVGIAGQDDVARLKACRSRLGWKIDLRVDANEAWTPANVVERIRALEPFALSAVEQPVPHADVDVLATVRRQVRVPIIHDESLCSRLDAVRAIERGTCDLFNLRLSKCGGFVPSLRLAQLARRHGLGYQLGCQIGETALLSASGRHFASSVTGLRYVEGSYDHYLVREALSAGDLTFGFGGWARALQGPGLGVEVDRAALERVTVRKERLWAKQGERRGVSPSWEPGRVCVPTAGSRRAARQDQGVDTPRSPGRGMTRRMTEATDVLAEQVASDGYRWRYRRYEAAAPFAFAHIVFVHGIQSHGGWYEHSCSLLARAGFTVSFLDRRGSGRNERDRGDAPGFRRLLDDIAEFLHPLRREGGPFLCLAGISWGGKIVTALQRRHPGLCDMLALLCPGFFPQVRPSGRDRLRILWSRLVAPRRLFPIPLNDPALFTTSPEGRRFIRDEPLGLRQATARLLIESVRLDGYLKVVPNQVRVPVLLLLAGRDRIIDNARTRAYVARFATTDQQVIEYPEAQHTLEFEPEPEVFVGDLGRWLLRHVPARPGSSVSQP